MSTRHNARRAAFTLPLALLVVNSVFAQPVDVKQKPSQFKVEPINPIPACWTQQPDAAMTIQKDANGDLYAHVDSKGTAYHSNGCSFFVVDVTLPRTFRIDSSLIRHVKIYGQYQDVQLDKNNCEAAAFRLVISKRIVNSRHAGFLKALDINQPSGVFNSDPDSWCYLGDTSGLSPWTPGLAIKIPELSDAKARSDTLYRVLLLPRIKGQPRAARVGWTWEY